MHPQERQSWFMLVAFGVPFLLYLCLLPFCGYGHGAEGVWGLSGLGGFAALIGRKERRAHKVVMDERDGAIARTATIIAYSIFWVCFVAACMLPWFILPSHATISVELLPDSLFVAVILFWTVRSLAIIILYRRDAAGTLEDPSHA